MTHPEDKGEDNLGAAPSRDAIHRAGQPERGGQSSGIGVVCGTRLRACVVTRSRRGRGRGGEARIWGLHWASLRCSSHSSEDRRRNPPSSTPRGRPYSRDAVNGRVGRRGCPTGSETNAINHEADFARKAGRAGWLVRRSAQMRVGIGRLADRARGRMTETHRHPPHGSTE